MKWVSYDYLGEWGVKDVTFRPMLDVEITNGKESYVCTALIDSGCDRTIINAEFAAILGIDQSKCLKAKVTGVSGTGVEAFSARVKIKPEKFDKSFDVNAVFMPGLKVAMLLGQDNFFEKYKVRFENKKKKFYLCKES